MTPSTAATDRTALSGSGRPASGSRNSGRRIGPSTSRSTIIGTLTRNTDPHQKYSSRTPPSGGPSTPPAGEPANPTPRGADRSWGSGKLFRNKGVGGGATGGPAGASPPRDATSIPRRGRKP